MMRVSPAALGDVEESETFAPALVGLENSLVPTFVVEEHADGRCTVFVHSAPTPGIGAIYTMAKEREHWVDATLLKAMKCISRWGAGSAELLKAMRTAKPENSPVTPDSN